MKKFINILFGILAIILIQACSEELVVDDVLNNVTSGAVLRNLGESNNLDIQDPGSTYSIILEAQDAQNGALLSEVRVLAGFNEDAKPVDSVDVSLFQTMPAAMFNETSPTTNGLPVGTFSTTLTELLNHSGIAIGDVSPGQSFVIAFEIVLTDGRIFNIQNATGNITRTGRFSYFNSQFRYQPAIGDPQRLSLDDISVADDNELGALKGGDVDTVFLTFDRSTAFLVSPTIATISTIGANDDAIGPLVQLTGDDADTYYFLYTAGASDADTVSFTVSDGSVTAGLPMFADTLKSAYIIDNVAPAAQVGNRSVVLNDTSHVSSISLELLFAEALGQDTVAFTVRSNNMDFDEMTVTGIIAEGSESFTLDFTPMSSGALIPDGALDFDIITDEAGGEGAGIADLLGNQTSRVYSVQIFD